MAAKKLKIPIVLHESNAFPGVAIKLLSKKAKKVLVGFEDAKSRIPNAKEVIVTGTPSKITDKRITLKDADRIKKDLQISNNLPIVLVFGGSQGARSINEALVGIIANKLNTNYQLVWAAGQGNYNDIKQELNTKKINIDNISNTKILPYIYNMQEVMELSDLVVSRSGAMTITEISTIGKPAIFIPFPFATENHQEYNAKVLENVGAAKIILDKDLTYTKLDTLIKELISNKQKLAEMGNKAKTVAKRNVADNIYLEIKKAISK